MRERRTRAELQQETREHLLEAAAVVFTQRGYHGATMDAVAQEAGYTKGAVYSNFANKEDLFLALLDDRLSHLSAEFDVVDEQVDIHAGMFDRLDDTDGGSGRDTLYAPDGGAWAILALEAVMYAIRSSSQLREQVADRYRQVEARNAELVESVGTAEPLTPEDIGVLLSALGDGLGLRMLIDPEHVTSERASTLFDQAREGLMPGFRQIDIDKSASNTEDE